MPRKTDGQKVDDLTERVVRLETAFTHRSEKADEAAEQFRAELADLRAEVRRVADRQAAADGKQAATDQRCTALEKRADRAWQVWLAVVAAGLALLVALLKK